MQPLSSHAGTSKAEQGHAPSRLLCLGNDLLADDALGFIVADHFRGMAPTGVEVVESSQSGFALIDDLLNVSQLVVVDTVVTGRAAPGTIYVLTEEDWQGNPGGSPHYIGLFEALSLARELDLPIPAEVVIVAIEAADCSTVGGKMHPSVKSSIPSVVRLVQQIASTEEHKDGPDSKGAATSMCLRSPGKEKRLF